MAIAPTFEAALMKAIRGAGIKEESLNRRVPAKKPLQKRLREIDDTRVFTLFEAIKSGYSLEELHSLTRVDMSSSPSCKTWPGSRRASPAA